MDDLKAQDLAEKRKVAPGWLDRDEKILEPQRMNTRGTPQKGGSSGQGTNIMDQQDPNERSETMVPNRADSAGEELDRAFGGMGIKQ